MTSARAQFADSRVSWLLLLCAGASLVLYALCFASDFPLAQLYLLPLQDVGKLTGHSQAAALKFFGAFAALFVLYFVAYRIAARRLALLSRRWRLVALLAPCVFVLPLIATYPVGALDVFDYSFFVRMLGQYGANPMVHPPADFPADPWLAFVAWPHSASPYGPLWQALSALIFRLANNDLLATIVAFKLVSSAALLGCAALVYAILRAWRPQAALSGFIFVAWNPLLLFESAANAHNDAVMVLFVLFALWLQQRRRFTLAPVALALAAFVKAPALIALPLFAFATLRALPTWRARFAWMLTTGPAVLLIAGLVYLPLAIGPNPFGNLSSHADLFTTSFATLLVFFTRDALGTAAAQHWALVSAFLLLSAPLIWIALSVEASLASLANSVALAFFVLLVVGTIWFQPWYLVWLLALAPLAARSTRLLAAVFGVSALAVYLVYDFALFWAPWFFLRDDGLTMNLTSVPLVFIPPLALLLAHALARVRSTMGSLHRDPILHA